MSDVRLRPAVEEDVDLVFSWRNDPFIVALGSLQQTVTLDEHRKWFQQSLLDRHRLLFIIEAAGESVGLDVWIYSNTGPLLPARARYPAQLVWMLGPLLEHITAF